MGDFTDPVSRSGQCLICPCGQRVELPTMPPQGEDREWREYPHDVRERVIMHVDREGFSHVISIQCPHCTRVLNVVAHTKSSDAMDAVDDPFPDAD